MEFVKPRGNGLFGQIRHSKAFEWKCTKSVLVCYKYYSSVFNLQNVVEQNLTLS